MVKKHSRYSRFAVGWALVCLILSALSGWANDPGGGTNGVGANVTVTDNGSTVTLANGVLTATITKGSATITSLLYQGRQMVSGNIYFSVDGGTSYENPANGVYAVKTNTTDRADLGFSCTLTNHHWFNAEIHYALGRGDTGLYVYAILNHPASYPDTSVGEWRMVWKMTQDQTERIYVDDIRNWQKPSSYDLANAQATGIAEIVKLTTGAWAGRYTCKYMYSVEYENVGCYGHASNTNKIGAWAVFGNFDYFNDGPTKQDLAPADGIIHIHFGRNHYNASSTTVAAGEAWTKFYGPWLLYCNTNAAGGNACWADAKAQVDAEKAAQPYAWLVGNTNYPPASGRGAVSGNFIISDPLKPALAVNTNTWIGLAQPDAGGNWQFESKRYQYWVHPAANGSFTIPNVRPGTYTLSAIAVGAVGEFTYSNSVTVTAAATNALGNLTWTVPHPGGQIAWEIGVPDRTAKEFRHGTNYWEPYLWETYSNDFPNPLEYTNGVSNWSKDWNYAHSGYLVGTNWSAWKWRIRFNLTNLPTSGSGTMTFAFASINYGAVQVFVNDENNVLGEVAPTTPGGGTGGNALIREGIHAKYSLGYLSVPLSSLRVGSNIVTLIQRRASASSDHVMYDYVNLELPAVAVLPAGRSLTWRGGISANAWDVNTTANWRDTNNATVVFTNGDNVTFDNLGATNSTVNFAQAVVPGSVSVITSSNYTFSGSGSITGAVQIIKAGSGTLTVNTTNNLLTGKVSLSDGKIVLGNAGASIGTGTLELGGGTLTMVNGGNLATAVNVIAPSVIGNNGNCTISGTISGPSTLTVSPSTGNVLSFNATAAGFSGTVTLANGSGNLRFNQSGTWGLPNGTVDAGTNVAAVYTRFTGGGTAYLGALTGGAGTSLFSSDQSSHPGSIVTYIVGALNLDGTFAGTVSDVGRAQLLALTKIGSGTWTLGGNSNYRGQTLVGAGTLQITGAVTTADLVIVSNTATLDLPGTITANTVQINSGGTLTGCGAINGNVLNNGTVIADCGATLEISGNVTNNGTMQFVNGSGLAVTGTFVNNGLLDILTGLQTLPTNFINNGAVLNAGNIQVQNLAFAGSDVQIGIQSYDGHTYQLQRTSSLSSASWQNIGAPQDGTGGVLTFTDSGASGNPRGFYRILVSP
ncbi:MAG: hypothetical protein RL380_957 [Verrucomicrobiota bacterium]